MPWFYPDRTFGEDFPENKVCWMPTDRIKNNSTCMSWEMVSTPFGFFTSGALYGLGREGVSIIAPNCVAIAQAAGIDVDNERLESWRSEENGRGRRWSEPTAGEISMFKDIVLLDEVEVTRPFARRKVVPPTAKEQLILKARRKLKLSR